MIEIRTHHTSSTFKLNPFRLIVVACGAHAAFNWIVQASGVIGYDWDIDHMMYFGQRLLAGEFHWTAEFDDRLPIMHILFALPAYTGSILGWFFLSTAFVVVGAWASFVLVDNTLSHDPTIAQNDRWQRSGLAALATVYLFAVLPGGFYHINPAAASAAAAALALLVKAVSHKGSFKVTYFILSALAASLSIGIRPYFLLPLISSGVLILACRSNLLRDRKGLLALALFWVAGIGVFGLLINLLPYLLLGKTQAFLAGIGMLAQELNPQGLASTISGIVGSVFGSNALVQFLIFSCIAAAIMTFSLLANAKRTTVVKDHKLNFMFIISFVFPAFLLFAILAKHFWPHYLQMFAPFIGMGAAFLTALWTCGDPIARTKWHVGHWALSISIVVIFVLPHLARDTAIILRGARHDGNVERLAQVNAVLMSQPENGRDFLFMDDMRIHWLLAEPRHRFPHAANTVHIIDQWWRTVDMPDWFAHPASAEVYCGELEARGPSLIFVSRRLSSFEESCLRESKAYRFIRKYPYEDNHFSVYSR